MQTTNATKKKEGGRQVQVGRQVGIGRSPRNGENIKKIYESSFTSATATAAAAGLSEEHILLYVYFSRKQQTFVRNIHFHVALQRELNSFFYSENASLWSVLKISFNKQKHWCQLNLRNQEKFVTVNVMFCYTQVPTYLVIYWENNLFCSKRVLGDLHSGQS